MNSAIGQETKLLRLGKLVGFVAAVLIANKFTLEFGAVASAQTAAFVFLIIVLLSAFFGDFIVAVSTSIVATLCFDFYYLPPYGTLNIAAFSDWISLAAFLLTSIVISHLTASAAQNAASTLVLNQTMGQLKEFGEWLLSVPNDQLTLSGMAKETLRIFQLDHCSIHVYGDGKWQHISGSSDAGISSEITDQVTSIQDRSTNVMALVNENMMGVRYCQINKGSTPMALLAVKSKTLPTNAIGTLAYMMGIRLENAMK